MTEQARLITVTWQDGEFVEELLVPAYRIGLEDVLNALPFVGSLGIGSDVVFSQEVVDILPSNMRWVGKRFQAGDAIYMVQHVKGEDFYDIVVVGYGPTHTGPQYIGSHYGADAGDSLYGRYTPERIDYLVDKEIWKLID